MMNKLIAASLAVAFAFSAGAASAEGDAGKGEKVFKKCAMCHTIGGGNKVGPDLKGVCGRAAGSAAGFDYSPGMKASGLKWDEATIAKWVDKKTGIKAMVKDTKMSFAGVKEDDAADVAAYINKAACGH